MTASFCSTDMDGHKSGKSFDQNLANLLFYAISLSACSLTGWMRGVEPVSSPCFTANLICQHQICCAMLNMQYTTIHCTMGMYIPNIRDELNKYVPYSSYTTRRRIPLPPPSLLEVKRQIHLKFSIYFRPFLGHFSPLVRARPTKTR